MNDLKLKRLSVFPIKSCGGINIHSANIQLTGFQYDRNFAVINAKNEIITARENPKLLSITTTMDTSKLIVSTKKDTPFTIDLDNDREEAIDIKIFNDWSKAKTISNDADSWFSNVLGEQCRLVNTDAQNLRKIKPKYNGKENEFLLFSDISPIHLISEASLQDLNSRLEYPVSIDNFRPNIVVSGISAYEEDTWKRIAIGSCEFEVRFKTPRCRFTTIDPKSTMVDPMQEPLRTLATFRKEGNYINFGIYLVPTKIGTIHMNDTVSFQRKNS